MKANICRVRVTHLSSKTECSWNPDVFPLTLTLSFREREQPSTVSGNRARLFPFQRWINFSLSRRTGEGWGEGKRFFKASETVFAFCHER